MANEKSAKRDRDESRRETQREAPQSQAQATPAQASAEVAKFPDSRTVVIQGYPIELPTTLRPGATLTETQALFYNTALHSAAMNTFAKTIMDMKAKSASKEDVQAAARKHFDEYEWSPRGPGQSVDPIEREARKQARSELAVALASKNVSLQAQDKDEANKLVDRWLNKHGARIRAEVKVRIEKAAASLDDDLLDGITLKTKEAPAQAEAVASA